MRKHAKTAPARPGRAWLPALACALLPLTAVAAVEEAPPAESPFFVDLPVVLSASRLAQSAADAPAAVFVIDREMIEASGARELQDVLRLAPGFIVAHDGGNRPAVGYHGLVDQYGRRMLVQIDGRPVYDPLFGGVRWADLPLALDDVERVEVIRGSNSASYGANAFLGVVNIHTRMPAASQGVSVRAAAGDPRYREALFRHGFSHGPLEVRYTLGYEEDDGFTKRRTLADGRRDRYVNDGKELNLATFDALFHADTDDRFRLQLGIKDGDLETGRQNRQSDGSFADDPEDPPRFAQVSNRFLQLDWDRVVGDDEALHASVYTNYRDYDDLVRAELFLPNVETGAGTTEDVLLVADYDQRSTVQRYGVDFQHTLRPSDALRMVWGLELRRDEADAKSLFRSGNPARDDMAMLFANLEWRARDDLVFNVGGQLEHHDTTDTDFSPRLAVNWQLHPRHTLRLAASRSVRVPSLFEAEADAYDLVDIGLPTPDGQPDAISQEWRADQEFETETVETLEFGWLFDLVPQVGLRGDVKLFYERYEDLLFEYHYPFTLRDDLALCDPAQNPLVNGTIPAIVDELERDRSPNAWRRTSGPACNIYTGFNNQAGLEGPESLSFANQLSMDIYGVEASIDWQPSRRGRLIASYSLAETDNLEINNPSLWDRDYTNRAGNWLDDVVADFEGSVPSHVFSALGILKPAHDLTFSAGLYHVSRTKYLEDGDNVPSYTRLDLRAARRFRLDELWQLELYGVVQNAGQDYADFENKNVFDTRAFVGIRLFQ